jgi:hypothetical protein
MNGKEEGHSIKLEVENSFGANFVQKKRGREVRNSLVFLEGTEAPHIVYPVGKHIGIRNLNTNGMMIIKQSDEVKEILSLTISTGGMRRYLAAVERQVHDNQLRVSIHDLKHVAAGPMKPPKTFNLSELAFGSGSRYGRGGAGHGDHAHGSSASKQAQTIGLPTGLFGLEKDKPDANQKTIASFAFSEDNKHIAFVITDQFPELKGSIESRVVVYDWSSKQKVVASGEYDYAVQKVSFNPKDWQ